jgi:hypothetical protein
LKIKFSPGRVIFRVGVETSHHLLDITIGSSPEYLVGDFFRFLFWQFRQIGVLFPARHLKKFLESFSFWFVHIYSAVKLKGSQDVSHDIESLTFLRSGNTLFYVQRPRLSDKIHTASADRRYFLKGVLARLTGRRLCPAFFFRRIPAMPPAYRKRQFIDPSAVVPAIPPDLFKRWAAGCIGVTSTPLALFEG